VAATDPAEVERCVTEALATASSFVDWVTLLRGLSDARLGSLAQLGEVADRLLGIAVAEGEVWGFREVARVRHALLADEPGAREALEAGVRTFAARPALGYQWVLLARGFVETLGDEAAALRCLAAVAARGRACGDPDDLCSVAKELHELGRTEEAVAALVEAEALAGGRIARAWTLANGWLAIGRHADGARVLEAALAAAGSSADALLVARAWSSWSDGDGVGRALAVAVERAQTAADWLSVAEVAFDTHGGEAVVRAALDEAAAGAGDDRELRAQVAVGYQRWLGDEAAADRVGPRGVRPDSLAAPDRRLEGWSASATSLWDWLRPRVGKDRLAVIAGADYGQDAARHLAALADIVETGLVPRQLGWYPGEVVELFRWSTGERVDHLSRAFCCTLLAIVPGDDSFENTAPQLVGSVLALGPEATERAQELLAWRCETSEEGPDAAALLALVLLCTAADPDDPRIARLVEELEGHPWIDPRALGIVLRQSVVPNLWKDLFEDILQPARGRPPIDALLAGLGHGR